MSTIIGWLSILSGLLAMVVNLAPGGVGSLIGLMCSLLAVFLSLFSVRRQGPKYFGVTLILAAASILLLNHALNVVDPLAMPLGIRIGLYGFVVAALAASAAAARWLGRPRA
jgi:hypothetical protein